MLQVRAFGFYSKCKRKSLDFPDLFKSGCPPRAFLSPHTLHPSTFLSRLTSCLAILPWPHSFAHRSGLCLASPLRNIASLSSILCPQRGCIHFLGHVKLLPLKDGVYFHFDIGLSLIIYSGWGRSDNVPVLSPDPKTPYKFPLVLSYLYYHFKKNMPGLICSSHPIA